MWVENFGSKLESNENIPKLKQATPEDVQKVWEEIEYSNHLQKVNDVLNVLDYPDNIEEKFRTILDKQDDITLIELAKWSKQEIQSFLLNNKKSEKGLEKKIQSQENEKQNKKSERIETKISKIKSTFTQEILNKNSDIKQNLEAFDLAKTLKEKESILREVLKILKQPWKLKSIVDDLWWANKNNPQYLEFKSSLIWIDSSFENLFSNLENTNTLTTNDIAWEIEKESWWIETIDLDSSNPISKLNLNKTAYTFEKRIDKQALLELDANYKKKLEEVQNGFTALKWVYTPFSNLLTKIWESWWKQDFKENLKMSISNFPSVFGDLDEVYRTFEINSGIQLEESDISSLAELHSIEELRVKIENIKEKFHKIQTQIKEKEELIKNEYRTETKELLQRTKEDREKQVEVLQFFDNCWFSTFPKEITDMIIKRVESNTLTIPWLNLNRTNIDLKNWHFGESWVFIDKDSWINIEAKRNLVKFVNKMISWDINEPLSVEAIISWVSIVDSNYIKNKSLEVWIMNNLWWKYNRIIENLSEIQK